MKGFWNEFDKYKSDLGSGFVVFLIAVPLSLGIAMASGVPPLAGLIAAVIGGLTVSFLGGGQVSINGPAAGLIVVVLHGVETLGHGDPLIGYRGILAVTTIAGLILIVSGLILKVGRFGDLVPKSVVHGMLAAIGVIIVTKQIHIALGVSPSAKSTLGLIAEIPHSLLSMNPEIALIGVTSLILLLGIPHLPWSWTSRIPVPMVVVLVGIALGRWFDLEHQHTYLFLPEHEYSIGPNFLVSLPENILSGLVFPDFTAITRSGFWGVLMSLVIVQGLETLLSASAVDQFDPLKRRTDLNKDLAAVGVGSTLSGLIGGLPIITEIVRSRANVAAGGQTRLSNFIHGLLVLGFVALLPGLIHQIPLAALAAILIVTGFKLASPSQFRHVLEIGFDQLAIFTSTLLTTLSTDLLIGVGAGILTKIALHLIRGNSLISLLKPDVCWTTTEGQIELTIRNSMVFSNFLTVKEKLESLPPNKKVLINLRELTFIDHTVLDKIDDFSKVYSATGGSVQIVGLDLLKPEGTHHLSARRTASR